MRRLVVFILTGAAVMAGAAEGVFEKTVMDDRNYSEARKACLVEWEKGRSAVVRARMLSLNQAFSQWRETYAGYRAAEERTAIESGVKWANYYQVRIYKLYCPGVPSEKRLPLLKVPKKEKAEVIGNAHSHQ